MCTSGSYLWVLNLDVSHAILDLGNKQKDFHLFSKVCKILRDHCKDWTRVQQLNWRPWPVAGLRFRVNFATMPQRRAFTQEKSIFQYIIDELVWESMLQMHVSPQYQKNLWQKNLWQKNRWQKNLCQKELAILGEIYLLLRNLPLVWHWLGYVGQVVLNTWWQYWYIVKWPHG